MHKLRLLTISIMAAGLLSGSAVASAASNKKVGSTSQPGSQPSSGDMLTAIMQKLDKTLLYWNTQMYQKDADFPLAMNNVSDSLAAQQAVSTTRSSIVGASQAFNQQVIDANQYTVVQKGQGSGTEKQFAPNVASPSDNLQTYSAMQSILDTAQNKTPYSFMDLVSGVTDVSPSSYKTVNTTKANCLYGFAGTVVGSSGAASVLATLPGDSKVECRYDDNITRAVNYIHALAGYGSSIVPGFSGQKDKLKNMSASDMTTYKNLVKNLVTARSAGEDVLYNLLQENVAVGPTGKSIVVADNDRYDGRADSLSWHAHIAAESPSNAIREQNYMMADIEKELNTLIQLQRKQLELESVNELQMSNLVLQNKLSGITNKQQAQQAQQQQQNAHQSKSS